MTMTLTFTPELARERAARGAAFLDAYDPDWYTAIDRNTLDMADGVLCILGQLRGEYYMGEIWIRDMEERTGTLSIDTDAEHLGFVVLSNAGGALQGPITEAYAMLQCAWLEILSERETPQ
jgi:hypothetical protein